MNKMPIEDFAWLYNQLKLNFYSHPSRKEEHFFITIRDDRGFVEFQPIVMKKCHVYHLQPFGINEYRAVDLFLMMKDEMTKYLGELD